MAKITEKVVTIPRLKTYKEETDKVYVAQEEGKGLIETEKVTKLDGIAENAEVNKIDQIKINGTPVEIQEKAVDITADVLAPDLAAYAKTEDVQSTYATKEEVGKIGTIKGTCLKEELESKKEGANNGDCWVVTDDSNHINYYNGTDFIDCGSHIDLSGYAKTEEVNRQLETKAETSALTSGLAEKADKTELEEYLKVEELNEATDDDIRALFQPE